MACHCGNASSDRPRLLECRFRHRLGGGGEGPSTADRLAGAALAPISVKVGTVRFLLSHSGMLGVRKCGLPPFTSAAFAPSRRLWYRGIFSPIRVTHCENRIARRA